MINLKIIPVFLTFLYFLGKIHCTVTGTFGTQGWPLPNIEIVYPKTVDAYKWFARYFLEGVVFPKLQKYVKSLLSQPKIMVKSWAKLQPRTEVMLKTLFSRNCCSKQSLVEVWKETPQCKFHQRKQNNHHIKHLELLLFISNLSRKIE